MAYTTDGPTLEETYKILANSGFRRLDRVNLNSIPKNTLINLFYIERKTFDVGIVIGVTGTKTNCSFNYWGNNLEGLTKMFPKWDYCEIHHSAFKRFFIKVIEKAEK